MGGNAAVQGIISGALDRQSLKSGGTGNIDVLDAKSAVGAT